MEKTNSKIITVLLTRYYSTFSNFIYYVTGRGYTHASISLGNAEALSYSRIGVVFCLLRIPFKIRNRYFCSQFVAETLQQTESVKLSKKASLYLPNELPKVLECQHCLRGISFAS
ncbi:MAG: hypothetical protein PHP50_02130 [Lachnospiraceae bacterium]|nr:hypothetical protein [Lachnospiraceae bacterium]